ncbi:unnamed protein product [Echinostoma caproni]|uniref:BTP domain-containing protein n=1 Tax=Echinostoma caproni TaxID=27848 RepID=A0A183A3J8_9TREM|nr:unnamed protein product [Echinostoma caproni]
MSSDIREVMSQVIARLCYQVGFDRINESALELLADVDGGNAQLEDGILALRLLKQSPQNLLKFAEEVGPYFSNYPTCSAVPLAGKVCLNVPPQDHEELKSRPEYIPEYLPLNFTEIESIDADYSLFSQSRSTESPIPKNNNDKPEPATSVSNTTTSITPAARVLPAWAQQTSYRIARVSIDPITKTLVEHAPPEKIQDLSPEISSVRGYGHCSGTSVFSDAPKLDSRIEPQLGIHTPSYTSSSYRQGATDEQWAAALQVGLPFTLFANIVFNFSKYSKIV